MMKSGRLWLVSYDIRCPRRWRRVFGLMNRKGAHRQLSVFLVRTDKARMLRLEQALSKLIDSDEDSLMIVAIEGGLSGCRSLGVHGPIPGARVVVI